MARAVLNAARLAQRKSRALDPLRTWALGLAQRSHHNKATCALANKLARICLRCSEPLTPTCQEGWHRSMPELNILRLHGR
jgi:transposase